MPGQTIGASREGSVITGLPQETQEKTCVPEIARVLNENKREVVIGSKGIRCSISLPPRTKLSVSVNCQYNVSLNYYAIPHEMLKKNDMRLHYKFTWIWQWMIITSFSKIVTNIHFLFKTHSIFHNIFPPGLIKEYWRKRWNFGRRCQRISPTVFSWQIKHLSTGAGKHP